MTIDPTITAAINTEKSLDSIRWSIFNQTIIAHINDATITTGLKRLILEFFTINCS